MVTDYTGAVAGSYLSLPFGDGFSPSGDDESLNNFALLWHDFASATDHAQFRQYSEAQGRWMMPDPDDGSYDFSNPQSFNRYSYVLNNPLSFTDLFGLSDCPEGQTCDPPGCPYDTCVVVTGDPPPGDPDPTGPGENPPGTTGGGGGAPNYGIPVKRKFSRNYSCSSTAAQVMGALENNFSSFANTTGGNTFSIFTPGSVSVGQQIDISVGLQLFGHTLAYNDVSVTVQSASSSSLVFQSTPTHVLYPATVSFSATDIGNGQINFTTSVNATTNGLWGTTQFVFGGFAGESNTWNTLLNNIGQFCSHP